MEDASVADDDHENLSSSADIKEEPLPEELNDNNVQVFRGSDVKCPSLAGNGLPVKFELKTEPTEKPCTESKPPNDTMDEQLSAFRSEEEVRMELFTYTLQSDQGEKQILKNDVDENPSDLQVIRSSEGNSPAVAGYLYPVQFQIVPEPSVYFIQIAPTTSENPVSNATMTAAPDSPIEAKKKQYQPLNSGDGSKDKKHFCLFCQEMYTRPMYHMQRFHSNEVRFMDIVSEKCSKRKRELMGALAREGDYLYNQTNPGVIVTRCRNPTSRNRKLLPCPHCKGTMQSRNLPRHIKKCSLKFQESLLIPEVIEPHSDLFVSRILRKISGDIGDIVRDDEDLISFGRYLWKRKLCLNDKIVIKKLRDLATLQVELGLQGDLKEYLKMSNVDAIIEKINSLAGYKITPKGALYDKPSSATRYCVALEEYSDFLVYYFKKKLDNVKSGLYADFSSVMRFESAAQVKNTAEATFRLRKCNQSEELLKTSTKGPAITKSKAGNTPPATTPLLSTDASDCSTPVSIENSRESRLRPRILRSCKNK